MKGKKLLSLALAAVLGVGLSANLPAIQTSFAAGDGGVNYLFRSTFESGADSWTGRGSASAEVSKAEAHDGSSSLYVSDRADNWNGASRSLNSDFAAGNEYGFGAFVMFSDGGSSEGFKLTLQYSDDSGTTQYDEIASATAKKGEWTKISNDSYTLPAGASSMSVYIEMPDSLIDFYLDDAYASGEKAIIKPPVVLNQRGDIDNDGCITAIDASSSKRGSYSEITDKGAFKRSDIDGTGELDAVDTAYVTGFVLGKVTEFPKIENPQEEYEKSYDFPAVNQLKSSTSMPDPFIYMDGSKVSDPSEWGKRASEISCMYEYYMYGMWRDGSDDEVSYSISGNTMTVKVKRISTGKTTSFPANISRPSSVRHDGGAPVIIGMHSGIAESTATANGYAVITIGGSMFSNPVASDDMNHTGAFYELYPYSNSNPAEQTGALMGWSWGCSKILDALYAGAAKELNINPENSIVTGVSRWGKAAMVCGAFDKRFKMCAPSCSGAGGVAIYRYTSQGKTYDFSSKGASSSYTYGQNEPLGSLQSTGERGWFNNRFLEFQNPNQLPMDQHMLCSLVADEDRYLFIIGSCVSEDWVNAPSMWLSYKAAKVVYDYLGIGDHIAINIHKEGHAVIAEDVNYMCQYFDYHVYGIKPSIDLGILQTSVFDLPKNTDPYFSSFSSGWTIK